MTCDIQIWTINLSCNKLFYSMKSTVTIIVVIALLSALTVSQQIQPEEQTFIYTPFTQEELKPFVRTQDGIEQTVTIGEYDGNLRHKEHSQDERMRGDFHKQRKQIDLERYVNHQFDPGFSVHTSRHPRHGKKGAERFEEDMENEFDEQGLTQEERQERRHQRKRFDKMFKWGMIIGTGVISIILVKFCIRKKKMCRMMREQRIQAQMMHQEYPVAQQQPNHIHPYAYPIQPIQPVQRQPQVRGRAHDSFPKQNNIEAQIKFHEAELNKLKGIRNAEENIEMRRNAIPINTTESFESQRPIKYRNIPVGQPIYVADHNSSFASEYPEI